MDSENVLASFLDQKFRKNVRVSLSKLIDPVKYGSTIRRGTLVLMASGDRTLRLRILDKDTPNKGFSLPLQLNRYAAESKVSPNYLQWYLSQDAIRDWLLSNATGSVFLRVPRATLYALPVALPTSIQKLKDVGEVVISRGGDAFSALIDQLYRDYLHNFKAARFRTAVILAGAICEVILYQLLLEQDVNPKMLKEDRGLGLGKMLDYVRLLKLDQSHDFPLTHLFAIQKNRNAAIHAGLLVSNNRAFSKDDLVGFDQVIKHFGL
jgi:hypothetical protein